MKIDRLWARQHFREANAFITGESLFIAPNSEIRQVALEVFGEAHLTHLTHVCCEIFRTVAEEAMEYDHWE